MAEVLSLCKLNAKSWIEVTWSSAQTGKTHKVTHGDSKSVVAPADVYRKLWVEITAETALQNWMVWTCKSREEKNTSATAPTCTVNGVKLI